MLLRNICIILIKWWKKYIFSEKYLPAQYKLEKKSTSIASCFPKYLGNPYDYEETTNFIQVLILSILSLFGVINVFAFSVFEIFEFSLFKFFSNFIVTTYTDKIILMWLLFALKMGFFCSYYLCDFMSEASLNFFLYEFCEISSYQTSFLFPLFSVLWKMTLRTKAIKKSFLGVAYLLFLFFSLIF